MDTTAAATQRDAPDGPAILANARGLEPLLREEADEAERRRRLTPRAVDALRAAGVFRMTMPASWGGPEVDILTQVEIIEAVSRADGSAGWCTMIGSDSGFYSASLDDAVARRLFPDLDAVTAGWLYPVGRLQPVDGGYLLTGRWSFGSGCTHADVIVGGALVFDGETPVPGPDGAPDWRIAVLPAGAYGILDTWHTTGLAGSGSHDYTTEATFVPTEQTYRFTDRGRPGPLYAWPGLFITNLPGVPLGIARDALDQARSILAGKLVMPEMKPARDEPRVRLAVARAEARVGSARSYVFDVLGRFWATLEAGDAPTFEQRAALGGCLVHASESCRAAVQLLYETVGSSSIYRSSPLERHLRDLLTIGQHVIGQPRMWEWAGGLWFGEAPEIPLL